MDASADKSHDQQYPKHLADELGCKGCPAMEYTTDEVAFWDDTITISHLDAFKEHFLQHNFLWLLPVSPGQPCLYTVRISSA